MLTLRAAAVAFVIVGLCVPLLRRLALAVNFVDRPSTRKIHREPIPLLGGAAVYVGIVAALPLFDGLSERWKALALGGGLLVAVGLVDDWHKTRGREFAVWPRIVLYVAAAAIPVGFGIRIEGVSRPFGEGMLLFPGWLAWLTTVVWIFALTNMLNFIDGVDGLASGIAAIAGSSLTVVAAIAGQTGPAVLSAVLAGACAAFLLYNFHPARIFLGDAGATLIGYTLALTAVDGSFKKATLVSILVPVMALGVPILDTAIVFARRLAERRGLHRADQLHTHHSLMKWGLSQTQTVSFLYLVGVIFSLASILLMYVWG